MREEFSFGEVKNNLNFLKNVLRKNIIPIVLITILGGLTAYYFRPDGTYVSKSLLSNSINLETPFLEENFSIKSNDKNISFEEIKTLFFSQRLLDKALLTNCEVNGREDILANHIIHKSNLGKITIITDNIKDAQKNKTLKTLASFLSENLDIYEKKGGFSVIEFSNNNQQLSVTTANVITKSGMDFLKNEYLPNYQSTIDKISAKAASIKSNLISLSKKQHLSYEENLDQNVLEKEYFQLKKQLAFYNTKKLSEQLPVKLIETPSNLASYKVFPSWLLVLLCSVFSFALALSFFIAIFIFSKQLYSSKSVSIR